MLSQPFQLLSPSERVIFYSRKNRRDTTNWDCCLGSFCNASGEAAKLESPPNKPRNLFSPPKTEQNPLLRQSRPGLHTPAMAYPVVHRCYPRIPQCPLCSPKVMPRQRDGVRKAAGASNGASHGSLSAEGREVTLPRHAVGASSSCPQVRGDRRAFALLPAGGCPHTPLQRPWALPARSGPSSPRPRSPQGEAGAAAVLPPPLPALAGPVRAVPPYHRGPSPSTTNFWA